MESFFDRYKNLLVLIAVLLAQVIGLAVQVRRPATSVTGDDKSVRVLRYWVVNLVAPPEDALHWFGSGVRGLWSNYVYLRGVRQQNRDLKSEVERLRIEQSGLLEDAKQGQRLQELLDFKKDYIYQTMVAQVIGTSGTDQSRVIYIDKGSHDGIKPDMAVITPDGIVGKVKDVFPHTAQVLQISDQTSGAGVLLETTRIRGILRGNVYGQPQVVNVMPDDRIKPGEKVLTSGGDQVFPRGLPVGVVDHVVSDPEHEPYIAVMIRPGANLSRLEEVMVIISTGGRMPKQEQEDLAISAIDGASARQRAAAALSAGLPSATDANSADPNGAKTPGALAAAAAGKPLGAQAQADALKQSQTGIPTPIKAVPPLHPDRYTPTTVPPASQLVPGQEPPHVAPYPPQAGNADEDLSATTGERARTRSGTPGGAKAVTPKPAVSLDANGDPVPPVVRAKPKPVVLDEYGDPIKPVVKPPLIRPVIRPLISPKAAAPPARDVNGNLIPQIAKPRPVARVQFDADGNPIKPLVKPKPAVRPALDANGNPITPIVKPRPAAQPALDASGKPIKPIVRPKPRPVAPSPSGASTPPPLPPGAGR